MWLEETHPLPLATLSQTKRNSLLGLRVGAGLQQQSHAVGATARSRHNQRRVSALRARVYDLSECTDMYAHDKTFHSEHVKGSVWVRGIHGFEAGGAK
jgi:hypothetical protein